MQRTLILYSWAFYDFANTIFSAVVLTFYFPLYLTGLTHQNVQLGLSTSLAMVLAGLAVPWLGALSDRTGRTKLYLIGTTFLCVTATFSLSLFTAIPLLMLVFLLACFFFHASLVFYNALLPVVARPENQGFASGLGTGLGYLGVLFSIPIAHVIDSLLGRRFVFVIAALLFLIFALPLFLWVPERRERNLSPYGREIFLLLHSLKTNRGLLLFFLGNFFVMEAMNTIIFWLVIYMARVFQPSQAHLMAVFLALNFSAFVFGLVAGRLADRWGSQKTLLAAVAALFVTLLTMGASLDFGSFVSAGLLGGGFGFAGIWTAGRKRVVELSPPGEVGTYFGIYNLTTKVSVLFSLIFSLIADRFGFQPALLSLTLPSGLGFLLLWRSKESKNQVP